MALTRLDNLYSSKTGKYLYVSPDDFNATDALDNRGNSPLRPFKTIQRAFIEVSRFSYVPGSGNDRFDQFSIMLMPGNHYIDNRPGLIDNTQTPEFSFDQSNNIWTDNSILDLGNPDNVLYKFNATTGGAIVPRGCSLIGYDLRRTIVRPLYVPDPVDKSVGRTSIFNLTGGCYLWQFTIKDGDLATNSPLYGNNVGKVYTQPSGAASSLKVPEFSHHKICIMEYAENKELDLYYEKVGKAFNKYQPTIDDAGELDPLVQENRIVGPLSDSRSIESLQITDIGGGSTSTVTITTKIEHGYFNGQYVAVLNTGLDEELNGTRQITVDSATPKQFSFTLDTVSSAVGLVSGQTYRTNTSPALGSGAIALAEIDSVESASPYVFNCSIRSTWGQCGMWANGSKATGFRSMVVAQYTGVSLQKDDRAFIRYDKYTNTWNEASVADAFATVPYHTKGDAYWKDEWRNFHIRASDDSFIQCVSVFAVGFFDHFLMESGGDMSITNSNSNFGNTSLHAIGHKGYSFNQDKGGYISDIIPPKQLGIVEEKIQYYSLDIAESNGLSNHTRLYLGNDNTLDPQDTPAATLGGFRIGARNNEKLYVKLGTANKRSELSPSGFKRYSAALESISPADITNYIDNRAQDAANRILENKQFIANEAYAYVTTKYPALLTNPNITIGKCKRDIGLILDAVISDLRLTLNADVTNDTSNINVVQAAESYISGSNLEYIDGELTETLDAYAYVEDLAIAAMRNWDYVITGTNVQSGSATVTVGNTTGLVIGMTVTGPGIPSGARIGTIPSASTITLIDANGSAVNATGSNSNATLTFDLVTGFYDTTLAPTSDDTITASPSGTPECANIANLIQSYFSDLSTILSNPSTYNVDRRESQVNTSALAERATVFVVNTGGGASNPHGFETGTPVRLVPRARAGTNPDKRLIRLPAGFNPNQVYYVIAPGRQTFPEDYSTTSAFNATLSNSTKLLLANSKENAAAGIYIYSSETDAIDSDVEIDIYQYVLDNKYDLHRYTGNVSGTGNIRTSVAHHFDIPSSNYVQEVFIRVATDINGSDLPQVEVNGVNTDVGIQTVYYARYVSPYEFSIHTSSNGALQNSDRVSLVSGTGSDFYVYSNKRESALRFDPTKKTTGMWYLNVVDESSPGNINIESILATLHTADFQNPTNPRTSDTWYQRVKDDRDKKDRIYRFRYVIPKHLQSVRDPLNGFVIKMRTDEKRTLVPQRLLLKPLGGAANEANFNLPTNYDPYETPVYVETAIRNSVNTNFKFKIQSARTVNGNTEITVFDHEAGTSLAGENFTVVEITSINGGSFVGDVATRNQTISWTGNSSGTASIHNVVSNTIGTETKNYLILKNLQGTLEYNRFANTVFAQGAVTANLAAKPDSIGDSDGASKSSKDDYLYITPKAQLYTAVPGDSIADSTGATYKIETVNDVPEIEDTFYIFDIDTIQQRIVNQQDGIYYLTCARGNISPFPQGPGVGNNFKNFKFSQPISQLYPLNYKNDPLWFQKIDSTLVDPPATISSADNYIHGLVTVNDNKNSETRESTLDFVKNLEQDSAYTENGVSFGKIKAASGNATSGSEDRKIPINGSGDSKLYVELRRPSIARSGNHTFEYLGFGPGNYSTGFPLRQEVILKDTQDFYAQAKREDGGIVFYTGLNSNGDLYIGNRKINAITGEETFLESAELVDSTDDSDDLGNLVTTFETAVRFEDQITVEGKANFNNEVEINVTPVDSNQNPLEALRIYSNVAAGSDTTLSRDSFSPRDSGDIILTQNKINAAIFEFNPRGNTSAAGQSYSFRTHAVSNTPSNITPNQDGESEQIVQYGSESPSPGDVLLKGEQVGSTGSLGWIYSNVYVNLNTNAVGTIQKINGTLLKISWDNNTNADVGAKQGSFIKISGSGQDSLDGTWRINSTNPNDSVYNSGFANTAYVYVNTSFEVTFDSFAWNTAPISARIAVSQNTWKELGVLGAETLRTNTQTIGNYKLGVNTIARSDNSASYRNGFTDSTVEPKANLDVDGTAFISGTVISDYNSAAPTQVVQDDAFVVGGSYSNISGSAATLRVATSNGGRVGVNTSPTEPLDKAFVVIGESRLKGDVTFENDLLTTNSTVNIVPSAATINVGTTNTTNSIITVGGAFSAPSASKFIVENFTTTLKGELNVDSGTIQPNLNGTASAPLQVYTKQGTGGYVDAFTRAVQLRLGSVAGTTTIRNALSVGGAMSFDSDVTLNGGNNTGQLGIARGQLGTSDIAHSAGSVDGLNIDYYQVIDEINGGGITVIIDTAGGEDWALDNTILPVQCSDLTSNPLQNISDGDYLLIGSEIIRVNGTPDTVNGRDVIPVTRGVDCTTASAHADNTVIKKLNVTLDATYITQNLDAGSTTLYLGPTSGAFAINDFIRLSAGSTCPSGEFVKITTIVSNDPQLFSINDGSGNDRFVVDSVCGAVTSTLTGTCDFKIDLTTSENEVQIFNGVDRKLQIKHTGELGIIGAGNNTNPEIQLTPAGAALGNSIVVRKTATDPIFKLKAGTSTGTPVRSTLQLRGDVEIYSTGTGDFADNQLVFKVDNTVNSSSVTVRDSNLKLTDSSDNTVFEANKDGSVTIARIDDYFTTTGGRKWIYLTDTATNTDGAGTNVSVNINYFVNVAAGGNLVLRLPAAQNGDMIRFVDIGGEISNVSQLVIRAPQSVRIQGDAVGTNINSSNTNAYNGGELVVNTPNAAFGLVYCGDPNAPTNLQGWWLMEI